MVANLKVLLVDDNPDDRALVIRALRREFPDVEVTEAGTVSALNSGFDQEFDLVITDYHLRWSDGITVLRRVKAAKPDCPVIMFTGTGSEEIAVEAMKSGLDDYVLKSPKHYARVAASVKAALERVASEKRAAGLESQLQNLLNRLNVGIFRATSEGRIIEGNPAFLKLLGWTAVPPDCYLRNIYFRPALYSEHAWRLQQTGRLPKTEIELRKSDGSAVSVALTEMIAEDTPEFIDGIIEDITERLKLEARIRDAQKMESVGRLAGGVAHELNNILTIVQGHTSLLLLESALTTNALRSLDKICSATERASTLTRQLLTFSRRQVMHTEPLNMSELVEDTATMLHHLLGEHVTLEISAAPDLPSTCADPGMIEQLLMNLAMNARDAMPGGGRFTVTTALVDVTTAEHLATPEWQPGQAICLTVSDTGCGMPAEKLDRIFEPFFTTKDIGQGSGLGLAAVYGIVKQHQGWIEVNSGVNAGTTFRMFFPVSLRSSRTIVEAAMTAS